MTSRTRLVGCAVWLALAAACGRTTPGSIEATTAVRAGGASETERQARAGARDESRAGVCPQLRPLLEPLVTHGWVASASIAVVDGGRSELCSFGDARPGVPATPDTLYEVGSLTKLLTGVLLAEMARTGSVSLEQPVSELVAPAQVPVSGRPITLVDLATQRSGLPRMPPLGEPRDALNPYADFDRRHLLEAVERARPRPAGQTFEYSNWGTALLGEALAMRAGEPYAGLLTQRVLAPLGMSHSFFAVPPAQRARSAQGHDADGAPRPAWDFDAFAPAGGLRSTARDMARFVAAALSTEGRLSGALQAAQRPRAAARGENRIGFFFQTRPDGTVWHNGETGGFSSYLALDARRRLGVCALLSTAFVRSDELGDKLLAFAGGAALTPLDVPPTQVLTAAQLDEYAGEYELSRDFVIRVFRRAEALNAQATGQPALRLWVAAPDRLYFRSVDAALDFERGADGEISALFLLQGGRRQRAARR